MVVIIKYPDNGFAMEDEMGKAMILEEVGREIDREEER